MTAEGAASVVGWAAALDRLDAAVDTAWVAMGCGDLDEASAAFELDHLEALPRLPDALAGRAHAVLERLRALDALLEEARREVRRELAVVQRLAPAGHAIPHFIDRSA